MRLRWLEITAWILGCTLLGGYVGVKAWAAHERSTGIEALHEAKLALPESLPADGSTQTAADVPVEQSAKQLRSGEPDTSAWSAVRIAAFKAAAISDTPLAVLRIPSVHIEVPVYPGPARRISTVAPDGLKARSCPT